jgi:Reverse transcriptase (RNA-dependent DNA polymerase)
MTDSFFQTKVHPDDIHKTAVTTPFDSYEWCVMPMGFWNAPAIHQRRVTNALWELIGKICHTYLDDIVIWSNSIDEHIKNVKKVMEALCRSKLYVNENKTKLFCYKIKFLGHKISQAGIEADDDKVSKILDWPTPKSASDVRAFLGLVCYLNAFLPCLAMQSEILSRLTTKECEKWFPDWTPTLHAAFKKIKEIVVSRECLTVIDHHKLNTNKIFLTADASNTATGAVLLFGPT